MITIFKTNSMKSAAEYVVGLLKHVDKKRPDVMHTVIVPDRASLEAERNVLQNVGGSFNIQVRTFRRFAGDLLPKCNYLGKQAGIIALTGIIQDNKDKLCCYTKGVDTAGFVADMYETISMLKYCKISPEQLEVDFPLGVQGKIKDIALLYSLYRQYTEGKYIDPADKIDLLCETVATSQQVQDGYFYLYDFDSFTRQELSVVENLIKYSKGVTVACCASDKPQDKHLYLNDIFDGVLSICQDNGIRPNIIESVKHSNDIIKQIGLNLFRYTQTKPIESKNFVEIFAGNTRVQEVYALACRLQKYVRNGGRFRDVYVVTSDVDKYENAISTIFDEFDIPYFCDRRAVLSDQPYVQFICDYAAMYKSNFKLSHVLSFVKNYLFCGDDNDVYLFENYCLKYNVSYDFSAFSLGKDDQDLFCAADRIREKLYSLTQTAVFPTAGEASKFVQVIRTLVEKAGLDVENKAFSQKQKGAGLTFQAKVTAQSKDKFNEVLSQAEAIMGDRYVKLEDFMKILSAALASVSISVLPVVNDCVIFANMAKARKHDIKFLALLGANYGDMPLIKADCNLLSDRNIKELTDAGINVEPSIYTENKRERFSVFQLLQEPSEKLYVSYAATDGKDSLLPSNFVEQFSMLFNAGGKPLVKTEIADEGVYTKKQAISKLILNKRRLKDNVPIHMPTFQALYDLYQEEIEIYSFEKEGKNITVQKGKDLYLHNYEVSVTRITDFYQCPYRFYLKHGLAVKPRPVAELNTADLGNILHAVLEKYVKQMEVNETTEQTQKRAEKIYDVVLTDDFYRGIANNPTMRNQLIQLKKEAVRMCQVVKKQLTETEFVNFATELAFGGKSTLKPVEVNFGDGKFLLIGKIDRVDVWNNNFIVLDYKSGRESAKYSEKALYIGHKLQLPVYVKAIQDNFGWKPAGFYYFKMHNDFTDANTEKVYSYNGRTVDDVVTATALDCNLKDGSSEKLGLKLKADGNLGKRGAKLLSSQQIEQQVEYATRLIAQAGKLMEQGYAAVLPYDGQCEHCDYANVCDYNDIYLYSERNVSQDVRAKTIDKAVEK